MLFGEKIMRGEINGKMPKEKRYFEFSLLSAIMPNTKLLLKCPTSSNLSGFQKDYYKLLTAALKLGNIPVIAGFKPKIAPAAISLQKTQSKTYEEDTSIELPAPDLFPGLPG